MSKTITRRRFIYGTVVGAVAGALSARSWSQVQGANSNIRHGVVGFRSRGRNHISGMNDLADARVVALCDVDTSVIERGTKDFADKGMPVEVYVDIRKMLDNKDIDTISIATPNHWHSLAAIWAMQAGKDVYLEKPVSHNVWEGRKVVETARKYQKICQTGTQSRSNPGMREAVQYIHDGNLGKIKLVRGLCYKRRGSIGKVDGPQAIPKGIDYDLWCGPAPMEPLMRKELHYDWHWVWPTGNGDIGNQGIHQMDIARWILQEDALSPAVISVGGRIGYIDDGTTPNTQFIVHEYERAPLIFEVRGLPAHAKTQEMDRLRGASIGVIVECENGTMVIPTYDSAVVYDKDGKEVKKFKGGSSHYENFVKAVRSRKHTDLNADILEGHLSSALCHVGNISHRLGAHRSPDEIREAIQDDKEAAESFGRMMEHVRANEVDLQETPLSLGVHLRMNPRTERFRRNREANAMLTRDYRKPYVVPENV